MAQPRRSYSVGDYIVGAQIGAGSFSTVWHGRHRVHGTEVAIKEIVTSRLNSKLQESLKSEIFILKRINHPNIIRLHDMMEEPGKIYIVLEYCKGGDLSMYIQQRHGKVPEATAKHFMQQLAKGLKVLRENNLIHRDLKPQNLLLTSNDDSSILKIADFGFARSLQPRGLAETLCGSPLYMAPEIMQLQKYDAKADLWSVGAILFQLVIGKTPFTGNNQIQLLQNIMKSTELQFPPEAKNLSPHLLDLCRKLLRRNPVERLTFEEFFNHPYLSERQHTEPIRNRQSHRVVDDFPHSERNTEESSQEDCLPFILDDDSGIPDGSPSSPRRHTLDFDSKYKQRDFLNLVRIGSPKYNRIQSKSNLTGSSLGGRQLSEGTLKESLKTTDSGSLSNNPKALTVVDSLELIDQEYVIVSGPPLDLSSSSGCASNFQSNLPLAPANTEKTNSPAVSVIGVTGRVDDTRSPVSSMSTRRISRESMDIANIAEQPSTDSISRIKSLQHCASSITELVNEMIVGGKQLEAFSVLLVVLAIWKQALHICHTYAASGKSSQETTRVKEVSMVGHCPTAQECLDISSLIEREFLRGVEHAEELAKVLDTVNMEMPDAMELIYQAALALGRRGAVDEYMGDIEKAVVFYSKAVGLLQFILVEAPCLILNPPFSLTSSDRYRIKNYIDVLNNRHNISQSQRMALFNHHPCPS